MALPASNVARKQQIKCVDLIVLGAGLAGTAIAWQAHFRGWSVALIDRLDPQTSSRVAAGLVTPVTGSRGAASWRWDEFYPIAENFYYRIEQTTGKSFWHVAPALKVFGNQEEKDLYQSRWIDPNRKHSSSQIHTSSGIRASSFPAINAVGILAPYGICQLEPAARLDTTAYLNASHNYFDSLGMFFVSDIDCNQAVNIHSTGSIAIESLRITAKRMVFCQGFAARQNRFFDRLPLHPARGDIIRIRSPQVQCEHVIHSHTWAVPIGEQQFLIGATYDRLALHDDVGDNNQDAMRFRNELMDRWESMTSGTFETGEHQFLDQRAAVRPASYDRHPLIGPHESHPNLYCMNGLGSKGTLMSPHLAEILLDSMEGAAIPDSLLWTRRK